MNPGNSIRHSYFLFVVFASIACLCAAQALAADALEPRGAKVNYSDLKLSTFAGAQTLYQRISGAARTVCGEQGRRIEEQLAWERCYRSAIADAIVKVNSPLLTLLHSGQSTEATATAKLTK